jgi:hypothetical protein
MEGLSEETVARDGKCSAQSLVEYWGVTISKMYLKVKLYSVSTMYLKVKLYSVSTMSTCYNQHHSE